MIGKSGFKIVPFTIENDRPEESMMDADVIPLEAYEEDESRSKPTKRASKKKFRDATVENLCAAFAHEIEWRIAYDSFRDELMWAPRGTSEWRGFSDTDYFRVRGQLEQIDFSRISSELLRAAVAHTGDVNRFDSAIEWLESLPEHDGVPRVETFLSQYFGSVDDKYTRSVSRYLWTALAGRVLSPGIKADMAPILAGPQGIGKSSGIMAMAPSHEYFCEIDFGGKDDDLARVMRGKLIAEVAELRGLRTRDLDGIKAFITRQHESWVPKYKEFSVTFPRRLVFVGTTNQNEFLDDETGNRRWLPVTVTKADREAIERDRLQLWAEARDLFKRNGVEWKEAQSLAAPVHSKFTVSDAWTDTVEWWLDHKAEGALTTAKILMGAIGMGLSDIRRVEEIRLGKIMSDLGYEKANLRASGKQVKQWVKR